MFALYCRLEFAVWQSNIDVIRAVRSRLNINSHRDPMLRSMRKKLYRAMIREHADARTLYTHVQTGRF